MDSRKAGFQDLKINGVEVHIEFGNFPGDQFDDSVIVPVEVSLDGTIYENCVSYHKNTGWDLYGFGYGGNEQEFKADIATSDIKGKQSFLEKLDKATMEFGQYIYQNGITMSLREYQIEQEKEILEKSVAPLMAKLPPQMRSSSEIKVDDSEPEVKTQSRGRSRL